MSFKKLYYLTETTYKGLYRGFTANDPTVSLETASKGTPTLGPGIYFSTEFDEARKYGKYMMTANINFVRTVSPIKAPSPRELESMINSSPKRDSVLEEFGDSKKEAMDEAIKIYQDYGNEKDAFIALYNSFYYPNYARQFCLAMVRLGFDGMIVPRKDGSKQFIVYNVKNVSKVDFKEVK